MIPKPTFIVVYNARDITTDLGTWPLEITFTDHNHGKADDLSLTLHDATSEWIYLWQPEKGDRIDLKIGYLGGPMVDAGSFTVDSVKTSFKRAGTTIAIQALSASNKKELRTKRTKDYEDKTDKEIVTEIAARHGLKVVGEQKGIFFTRRTQRRASDLEFLTKLAEDYDYYFVIKGDQLVFMPREDQEKQRAVRTIAWAEGTKNITADFETAEHGTYSKAKAKYLDPDKKETIEVEVSDEENDSGDTLSIDKRFESDGQARQSAEASLKRANGKAKTARASLVGDPFVCAGQVIAFAGFGFNDGLYLIEQSRHKISRSSAYVTELDLKGLPS